MDKPTSSDPKRKTDELGAKLGNLLRKAADQVEKGVDKATREIEAAMAGSDGGSSKRKKKEKKHPPAPEHPANSPHTGPMPVSGEAAPKRRSSGVRGSGDEAQLPPEGKPLNPILMLLGLLVIQIWAIVAIIRSIGPLIDSLGHLIAAIVSTISLGLNALLAAFTWQESRSRIEQQRLLTIGMWIRCGHSLKRLVQSIGVPWGFGPLAERIKHGVAGHYVKQTSPMGIPRAPGNTPGDFSDRYAVIEELKAGGSSARVFVVRKLQEPDGKRYVLKHFDLTTGSTLEGVMRENHAAGIAQQLGLIVDSELGSSSFWYVMPHYTGQTLTKRVMDAMDGVREGAAPDPEAQRMAIGWVHQLLQVAAAYHEAGVIHKDIKPDNLIVNGDFLHVVDIGLLTPLASVQQLTTHGTEYFRDPEMVKLAMQGRAVRDVDAAKFDIYAIGAVLFFCFEGHFPANGSLSRFTRNVPRAVQTVVSRALAPMQRRYATARQMLADVDYLAWAAARGILDDVRAADLPGMKEQSQVAASAPELASASLAAAEDQAPHAAYPPAFAAATRYDEGGLPKRRWSPGQVIGMVSAVGGLLIALVSIVGGMMWEAEQAQQFEESRQMRLAHYKDQWKTRMAAVSGLKSDRGNLLTDDVRGNSLDLSQLALELERAAILIASGQGPDRQRDLGEPLIVFWPAQQPDERTPDSDRIQAICQELSKRTENGVYGPKSNLPHSGPSPIRLEFAQSNDQRLTGSLEQAFRSWAIENPPERWYGQGPTPWDKEPPTLPIHVFVRPDNTVRIAHPLVFGTVTLNLPETVNK